jgi:hypothetical protein
MRLLDTMMRPVNVLKEIVALLGIAWLVPLAEQLAGRSPPPDDPATTLWYRQSAKAWTEAMATTKLRIP